MLLNHFVSFNIVECPCDKLVPVLTYSSYELLESRKAKRFFFVVVDDDVFSGSQLIFFMISKYNIRHTCCT